jgi:MFS family permease
VYWRLLRDNPSFTRLWLSQVVSLLGDWFSTIVLAIMIREFTRDTGYSGLAVSGLFLAQTLPPLLASPVAGVLVDRLDRKMLLVWSNLLRAVVVLGLLFVTDASMLWLLYTLRVIQFFLSAVFEPGQSALVPSLVHSPGDLNRANTVLNITWSVMLAVGAVIGGIVGSIFGVQVAIIIDALTFLLAGGLLAEIQVKQLNVAPITDKSDNDDDRSFREALRYLRRHPSRISSTLVKGGSSVGNMDTILTFYATSVFVWGANGELSLGLLFSAFGVGALFGPLMLNRYHGNTVQGLRRMIGVGFAFITLGWFAFGASPVLWVAAIAVAFRAIGGSSNWVYSTTLIQQTIPNNYLGRVFSLDMAGFYLVSVVSTLIHGIVIDAIGDERIRAIVYVTGAVSALPFILWWVHISRQEATAQRRATASERG